MGKRGPQKLKLTGILAEFAEHLRAQGYSASSVEVYTKTARQFIKHVGTERIDRALAKPTPGRFSIVTSARIIVPTAQESTSFCTSR